MKKFYKLVIATLFLPVTILTAQEQYWEWAKTSGEEFAANYSKDIAADSFGNAYTIGYFSSNSITFDNITLTKIGVHPNIYLTKHSSSGDLVWAKNFGGANDFDQSCGVATDQQGNVYITGTLRNTSNFDGITLGPAIASNRVVFIAKYNSAGGLVWAVESGETIPAVESTSIAVNSVGQVYIGGYYGPGDLTFGTTVLSTSSNRDFFLTKYSPEGEVLWARNAATEDSALINDIAIGSDDLVYVIGDYAGSLTIGATTLPQSVATNFFVAGYYDDGSVNWAIAPPPATGGGDHRYGHSITKSGIIAELAIAGSFKAPMTIGSTNLNHDPVASEDMFIAKVSAFGEFGNAVSITGNASDEAYNIEANFMGTLFVTGYFQSTSLSLGDIVLTKTNNRPVCFVAAYGYDLTSLWATYVPETSNRFGGGIAIAGDSEMEIGNVYVAGSSYDEVIFGQVAAQDGGVFTAKLNFSNLGLTKSVNDNLDLFPNPVDNILNVKTDGFIKGAISMFNPLGQKVSSMHFNGSDNQFSIDMSSLETGIYIIQINTADEIITRKIFKR